MLLSTGIFLSGLRVKVSSYDNYIIIQSLLRMFFCLVPYFCQHHVEITNRLSATAEPDDDEQVTRAKYFIRDEFLVSGH